MVFPNNVDKSTRYEKMSKLGVVVGNCG